MIPMSELIKDPVYKEFLQTPPLTPRLSRDPKRMKTPPWTVYVQKEAQGPWGKKEFWKYSEAFKFLRKALKLKVNDCTINNRRIGFSPPARRVRIKGKFITGSDGVARQATKEVTWKPKLAPEDEDHHWCRYCRRPTVFKYFKSHKALKGVVIDTTIPRCCICGASIRIAIDHATDRGFHHA